MLRHYQFGVFPRLRCFLKDLADYGMSIALDTAVLSFSDDDKMTYSTSKPLLMSKQRHIKREHSLNISSIVSCLLAAQAAQWSSRQLYLSSSCRRHLPTKESAGASFASVFAKIYLLRCAHWHEYASAFFLG